MGASAISSLLGKGDDAHRYLGELIRRFVKPNTMYLEAGPVIETPLAAAQAVHDMLLQSWGDTLRVFPAVPAAWKEVAFQDLRAQGAFLVSAARREGRTSFVRVTSLAGEPVTLRVAMSKPAIAAPRPDAVVPAGEGAFTLKLAQGEVATFTEAGAAPRPIAPGAARFQAAQLVRSALKTEEALMSRIRLGVVLAVALAAGSARGRSPPRSPSSRRPAPAGRAVRGHLVREEPAGPAAADQGATWRST